VAAQLAPVAIENKMLEPILQYGTCAASRAASPAGGSAFLVRFRSKNQGGLKRISRPSQGGWGRTPV
jgi:hypothetical protein